MSNDLISRDDLRENIERIKQNVEEWVNHTECDTTKALVRISLYDEFIDLIDNAPTVEPFERIGAICNENCGYRPQGKWILRTDTEWHFECNQCKGLSPWKAQFCGVCGADMRGKK